MVRQQRPAKNINTNETMKAKTAKTLKPLPAPFAPSLNTIGKKKAAKAKAETDKAEEPEKPAVHAATPVQMSAYINTPATNVFTPGATTSLGDALAGKLPIVPPGSANPSAPIAKAVKEAKTAKASEPKEPSKRAWTVDQIIADRTAESINNELSKKWPGDFNAEKSTVSINTYRSDLRFYFKAFHKAGLINGKANLPELFKDIAAE